MLPFAMAELVAVINNLSFKDVKWSNCFATWSNCYPKMTNLECAHVQKGSKHNNIKVTLFSSMRMKLLIWILFIGMVNLYFKEAIAQMQLEVMFSNDSEATGHEHAQEMLKLFQFGVPLMSTILQSISDRSCSFVASKIELLRLIILFF